MASWVNRLLPCGRRFEPSSYETRGIQKGPGDLVVSKFNWHLITGCPLNVGLIPTSGNDERLSQYDPGC